MRVQELARLVQQMRFKQLRYYGCKDRRGMSECLDLERRVDTAIRNILEDEQPELFWQDDAAV